ncbi:MAG: FAD-dependent oxidoreductase [Clostridia bacterium]|nr:FAD-dependent oxidoreductase [Clostridia bacterium]
MEHYQVIVVGGGFSGTMAAIAAARDGAKVLLIEKSGALGGAAVLNHVLPFMEYHFFRENGEVVPLNRGLLKEFVDRLRENNGILANDSTFNEEYLKVALDDMTEKYGVDVLFHTTLIGANRNGDKLTSIEVFNIEGKSTLTADLFIDATGDAMLTLLSGEPFKIGREPDEKCQPMTLCFRLGKVDVDKFYSEDFATVNEIWKAKLANGDFINPRENILSFIHTTDDVLHLNSTRVNLSPVSAKERSDAEKIARKQMIELTNFLREYAPSCKNATLLSSATEIGVRESRMIDGVYTLTGEDITSCRKFEDAIAAGNYGVDIHSPDGTGTLRIHIPKGEFYTIPYRCLLPKGLTNMLVVGRCISSTHEAQSAYRVMTILASVGEGAGIAAAIALNDGVAVQNVDREKLRKAIDGRDLVEGYPLS